MAEISSYMFPLKVSLCFKVPLVLVVIHFTTSTTIKLRYVVFIYLNLHLLQEESFSEVPSVGVWMYSPPSTENGCHDFTLFPWQQCVWPGTLDPVRGDLEFIDKIAMGECLNLSISKCQ